MGFKMGSSGAPAGHYTAVFSKWETSVHEEYGDRVQFSFAIESGEHKGKVATRFTSTKTGPKSGLSKIAQGLAGKKFDAGEEFDPDAYVGRKYLIVVAETDSGATRVESVLPAQPADGDAKTPY